MIAGIRYFCFSALAIAICSGCDSQTAQVSGTVQRNGQAIPGGKVLFMPVGEGKPAVGPIQPDGSFEMMTESPGDGAMTGQYRVVIAGEAGSTDALARTSYKGPRDKPVEVVGGRQNEFVFNVREEDGWEAITSDE